MRSSARSGRFGAEADVADVAGPLLGAGRRTAVQRRHPVIDSGASIGPNVVRLQAAGQFPFQDVRDAALDLAIRPGCVVEQAPERAARLRSRYSAWPASRSSTVSSGARPTRRR